MAGKKSTYYDDFSKMIKLSVDAAEFLKEVLTNFRPDQLLQQRDKMHEIEHEEDQVKHELMRRLAKEFVTPIDREDIIAMANVLDDVTDTIDDIVIHMYIFNITEMKPAALRFADVILRSCIALKKAMNEFSNFHKSDTIRQAIIDVSNLEEEGDQIYIEELHKLYAQGKDPLEIAVWTALYERFENCCDACEHVADQVEVIIMKNS